MTLIDWATVGTAVGTLALAVATYWMAAATKEMAETTKKSVLLEAEPQLAMRDLARGFDDIQEVSEGGGVVTTGINAQFGLILSNPGKVLVQYRVEDIALLVNDREVVPAGPFLSRGGVVHPGNENTFYYPRIPIARNNEENTTRIRFRIRYWSVPEEVREMRATVEVGIRMFPVRVTPWLFAEGPIYEGLV